MSQEEQANQQSDVLNAAQAEGGATPSSSRRRFIAGLATGSIVMTVASRPAIAGGGKGGGGKGDWKKGAWCTPSAWVSGNLSQGDTRQSCGGRSPGYWKANAKRWPSKYKPGSCKSSKGNCTEYKSDGTAFHQSKGGPFAGSFFGSKTMMQVLWLQGHSDPYQLGAHIVAAFLNASTIANYGMTPSTVVDMWYQLNTQGFYQPSPGAPMMTAEEVVIFIQNTFDN
ncbi:MAG: hypothetical protein RBT81_05405 [Gammaproteobacteria bacterium]|jgi:hypothetical protein|nr:hypothetical protein [Gammaproteobacteria bacterium]